MRHRDHIAASAGLCGWLAYSPPAEVGKGQQVTAYGPGGFSIWTGSGPSSDAAPRLVRASAKAVSFAQAREIAKEVDRWLAFDHSRRGPKTCKEWVEAIIADLPLVLQEAIDAANERTTELRIMHAAATGDTRLDGPTVEEEDPF